MNSLSDEFLRQATKLKKLSPGILKLKFNENGSVIVIRNGSNLHHDKYEQIKIRLNETEMTLTETQSELEKLKQERMAINKNSETNSSILDKILDEMEDENYVITWKNINSQLKSISVFLGVMK
ncbi:43278_t:CDS:2 [Gigaspora margarita]|uniref:43278_t:CDS:1 n=1 Tax=Gigaspora margarita TaxID=4874 RepID=A0ABN7VP71_GIGMA|nr:43278_t:CDS:2 [Gigaspora margarita]